MNKVSSNLLVIMSDEHQWRAMSGAGHSIAQTPNLDALAARGTHFTNAYTPSPICVPARASFATGQYAHQIRLWDNAMPYIGQPEGWGHALQRQGNRVESIGKLHYRDAKDPAGFDEEHIPMQVANGVGMVWASIRREDERVSPNSRMLGQYIGAGESTYTQYDRAVTGRTCEWLEKMAKQEQEQPWCLYVGLVAPHFPLVVPQEFLDLYPLNALPADKLHPRDGYQQHPWVAKVDSVMSSESAFRDENERLTAIACYYGLVSWMDHNVGLIMDSLIANGLAESTSVIYTSDHGDNIGARGLWGKSNLYQEAAAVPLIVTPPLNHSPAPATPNTCETPVNLIDISETILDHFNASLDGERPGKSLYEIAAAPADDERIAFSEYHAVGAVSGAYMVRLGSIKYIHYHGFEPEMFDLATDPEETTNLAADPGYTSVRNRMIDALHSICDPQVTHDLAFADQAAMIDSYGGREAALKLGAPAATPPPKV